MLTEHLRDCNNQPTRKAGSVGIVVKCPPSNSNPYIVRFADESEVEVAFDRLTMRRREIENILNAPVDDESYRKHIVYRCQVGSHAFGLNDENSDTDVRGIFLPPANLHWSMFSVPEQIEFQDGDKDEVFWELEKFLKLALKANPNILETLWTPIVLESSPIGDRLRDERQAFLSNHVYKTYSGYVLSQFRRMKNAV